MKNPTHYKKPAAIAALIGLLFLYSMPASFAQAAETSARYIISFKSPAALALHPDLNLKPVFETADPQLSLVFETQISSQSAQDLRVDPGVNYVEADSSLAASGLTVTQVTGTNDPFFTFDAADQDHQWYLPKIHVDEAWQYSQGSNSVIVAVIDTGIHGSHIELNDGRVIAGFNALTRQPIPAGTNSDDNGHGTAVAGILGAIANNQRGIAGINWKISLMPVKALQADGTGEVSVLSNSIVWATDHGANIINMSLGGSGFSQSSVLTEAVSYAYHHNVLIVAAAGNDLADQGINLDQHPAYPVCADNGSNMILGVAATDIHDRRAAFSDYGVNCVDISAPGERMLTTAYLPADPSDNVLIYGSGTSLAAPIVSGVAALIKAANPSLRNTEIQALLMSTADNIYPNNQTACAGSSCNGFLGSGRVNAQAALFPQPVANATLIRENLTGKIYFVVSQAKRLVTDFVFTQRGFSYGDVVNEVPGQLALIQMGSPLLPLDGTLLKSPNNPTVYIVSGDSIHPVTFNVFMSRGFSFAKLVAIPDVDLNQLPVGQFYPPADGTAIQVDDQPLIYVMDKGVRRPTTYFTFTQRKLSFAKVLKFTGTEASQIAVPADPYWLSPLEGTLVKSADSAAVYVVEGSSKHILSAETFKARSYSFSKIKVLPQAEIDVIAPGAAL